MVEFDYSKLRGRIKEKYLAEYKFAKALGISSVSLSKRLNNEIGFDNNEIRKSCELLDIPLNQSYLYFFTQKLKKT